ncbi:snare protein TLG1/Syntaxin [Phlegmacium glaucopus]|nr:snare protein TLG1/Syntaxin [Phlegmacium glaucopus]
MSIDPYHAVQREIEASLQSAAQLQSSYTRIRSMAKEGSEELMWARNELKATLASLEADLEDLDESVKIVESTDARMFGLDDAEVQKRRRYVGHVRKEIQKMRGLVSDSPPLDEYLQPSGSGTHVPPITPRAGPGSPFSARYGEDHQAAWAKQEQQMMLREQDHTMDSIAGTLHTIAQQASLMGNEIEEHNEMLDDLEQNVDSSENKMSSAMRRMRKFLRDSEDSKSNWCIIILMIVLMALLLAVILV